MRLARIGRSIEQLYLTASPAKEVWRFSEINRNRLRRSLRTRWTDWRYTMEKSTSAPTIADLPPEVVLSGSGSSGSLNKTVQEKQQDIGWFRWCNSSLMKLAEAEGRLFSSFGARIVSRFIPIRFKNSEMYTVTAETVENTPKAEEPIVLVHGLCAGTAIWCANIGALSKNHTVHAFDLLGFGRSSRPAFDTDPTLAELEMVESIEDWRKGMGIEKMYLVAHSFGAYLASSYALEHPNRVKHLVLVDPWGFPEKTPDNSKQVKPYKWMIFVAGLLSHFNPLAALRAAGPYGPTIVKKLRPDLRDRYRSDNPDDIYDYIYHCNAQSPTGETAFKGMTEKFGWAKRPMMKRFNGMDESVPITFIYGSKSWISPEPAFEIQAQRRGHVDVQIIRGAGHHVYADTSEAFNEIVTTVLSGKQPTAAQASLTTEESDMAAAVHRHSTA